MPRLPPVTNATFPSNLLAPLLAIDATLYHSQNSHEITEESPTIVDFPLFAAGAHLRNQSLDGAGRRLDGRALAVADVRARSVLACFQSRLHDRGNHGGSLRASLHLPGARKGAADSRPGAGLAKSAN